MVGELPRHKHPQTIKSLKEKGTKTELPNQTKGILSQLTKPETSKPKDNFTPQKPPQESLVTKQFKGLRGLLTFAFNVLVPLAYELFQQTVKKILRNTTIPSEQKAKIEYATTCVNPSIIYREMYNSVIDDIAQLVINISKKYKVHKESPLLSLKVIDLIKRHGGFNLQATKEFYTTAPSIYFNIFRSPEGLIIINESISILVEAVDTKMAQARHGVDQSNSQLAQKATESILKTCDLLIKSEQAARKVLEMAKSERVQQKIPVAYC